MLITFWTNGIQALQPTLIEKCVNCKEDYFEKLISFDYIPQEHLGWTMNFSAEPCKSMTRTTAF